MSNTHQMLSFIRARPEGVTRSDIQQAFPHVPLASIDGNLARMRNYDLVYNNGVMGAKGSIWYPRTFEGIPAPFPKIAADLIAELRQVHRDGHELHLAKRLHEIFETPN